MAKENMLLAKAKTALILDQAFFATLILKMEYKESNEVNVAGTNGKEIITNPENLSKYTIPQVQTILAHEIFHCVFGHHVRRGDRDSRIWNNACDLAINPLLIEYGFDLPSDALYEPKLKGMTAEQIYNLIMNDDKEDSEGAGKYQNESFNGDGGSLGIAMDAVGEDGEPASEAERAYQEADWKISATQAANMARKAGTLPSGLQRLIEDYISPKLPWEELLYKYFDTYSYNDFSWAPPNKRFMNQGIYVPSVRSKELKKIHFACDASGSVMDHELGMMASALDYLANNFRSELSVLWFDTQVHKVDEFDIGEPIELKPQGGGGTDFRAPFVWLEKEGVIPTVLIVFTDMECDRYPEEPEYPVIWMTWCKNYQKPPFGTVIQMQ